MLPDGSVVRLAELKLAALDEPSRRHDAFIFDGDSLRVTRRADVTNSFLLFEEPTQRLVLASESFANASADDRLALYVAPDRYFYASYPGVSYRPQDVDSAGAFAWVGSVAPGYARQQPAPNPFQPDTDGDAVPDVADNCTLVANGAQDSATAGPSQYDTDGDGFGNRCDADLNNDCVVNVVDLGALRTQFFSTGMLDEDFNGDGVVNAIDLGLLRLQFFAPPGPSGVGQCP